MKTHEIIRELEKDKGLKFKLINNLRFGDNDYGLEYFAELKADGAGNLKLKVTRSDGMDILNDSFGYDGCGGILAWEWELINAKPITFDEARGLWKEVP